MTVNRSIDGLTSNMHLQCYLGIGAAQRQIALFDISIPGGSMTVCPGRGVNLMCLSISRGYTSVATGLPVPDQWQMIANDPQNGGATATGAF